MKRTNLTANQRFRLATWLTENHSQLVANPRTRVVWARWATEALGFDVTVPHLKSAQAATGLDWPGRGSLTASTGDRIRSLEDRVAAIEAVIADLID